MKAKNYYHVTSFDNIGSIAKEGLKSNELGEIFLLDSKDVAATVARNQCGLRTEYALFRVDPKGLIQEPEPDRVAESTASHQWIARQERIEPKHLTFVNMYTITN